MISPVWPGIESLIQARDLARLVPVLVALDDHDRRTCVRPLRELSRSGEFGTPFHLVNPLGVAGAAILPDARALAAWLRRFEPQDSWPRQVGDDGATATRAVIELLTWRDAGWLPTLFALLVERLRPQSPFEGAHLYEIAEALREHLDLAPPADSTYVAQWILVDWPGWAARGTIGPPGHEQEFREVFPLAIDQEGMAQWLAEEPWRSHLEAAIDRGDVDRVALLDACLARLQRGGRARDTQAVVALHDVLGPTFDEVAERRRDYLALLPPGSRSPVVVMAQRELRRLHEAGVLTAAELVEQSRSMLLRTEKKVMRDHLALLKVHALAVPGDVDAVVEAASAAFGNAASDIQRAGVDLVAAQAGTASPQALDAALVAASVLPRDLEDRLRARAGIDGAGRRNEAPVAVLTAPDPAPVTPIEDREEAIAELLALVRREDSDMAAIDVERVVEALPRLAARDREGLRQAASSLLDQPWYEHRTGWGIGTMLELLVASCAGEARPVEVDARRATSGPVLDRVVQLRIADLTATVRDRPGVRSVALPSFDNGVIRGDALLTRLAEAKSDGWQPAELDLELALLRLNLDGLDPEPFEALATPAGRQVAAWIRGGGPDVPTTRPVRVMQWEHPRESLGWDDTPAPPTHLWVASVVPAPPGATPPGALWALLHSWSPSPRGVQRATGWGAVFELWAWTAPHHREVVAAHLLCTLARAPTEPSRAGEALVPLACAEGRVGDAMLLAIGCAMGAKQQQTRSSAVDALLVLAARCQLDGARLGELLAAMVAAGDLVLARIVGPLTQAAAAGAGTQTWAAVATLLGAALTGGAPVTGLAELLSAAVDIAEDHRISGAVPGLDEMAARTGRSQQVVEARRLRDVLARNAG